MEPSLDSIFNKDTARFIHFMRQHAVDEHGIDYKKAREIAVDVIDAIRVVMEKHSIHCPFSECALIAVVVHSMITVTEQPVRVLLDLLSLLDAAESTSSKPSVEMTELVNTILTQIAKNEKHIKKASTDQPNPDQN